MLVVEKMLVVVAGNVGEGQAVKIVLPVGMNLLAGSGEIGDDLIARMVPLGGNKLEADGWGIDERFGETALTLGSVLRFGLSKCLDLLADGRLIECSLHLLPLFE